MGVRGNSMRMRKIIVVDVLVILMLGIWDMGVRDIIFVMPLRLPL